MQHVFESARILQKNNLIDLLKRTFTIDINKIPDYYQIIFDMPWLNVYTLNIDDLATAASRKFSLKRPITSLSTTGRSIPALPSEPDVNKLEQFHINGMLEDIPDNITFSMRQYSARLGQSDPVYARISADLVSKAIIFIGTELDEPSLWQHIEMRKSRGGRRIRELRPKSFLVTPELDRAKQLVLQEYNVHWIPMRTDEFADILSHMNTESLKGYELIKAKSSTYKSDWNRIPLVSDLAISPNQSS